MKSDPLDSRLAAYAQQPLPPCPAQLSAGIWREIERRRGESFWSRILPTLEWRELFTEPRLAAAALFCALVAGVLPATLMAKTHEQQRLASQSIHFDVFSPKATARLVALASASQSQRP